MTQRRCRPMEACEPLPATLGGREVEVRAAVQEDLFRRRPLNLLLQPHPQRRQVDERLGDREVRLRAKPGLPEGLHRPEDVRAVARVHFADHAVPALLGPQGDLERAAVAVPLERAGAHRLPGAPTPLGGAEPIERVPNPLVLEHGPEGGEPLGHVRRGELDFHRQVSSTSVTPPRNGRPERHAAPSGSSQICARGCGGGPTSPATSAIDGG